MRNLFQVCAAGAIDYTQKDEIITREYGAIVVATGFDTISLDKFDEYYYNQSKDVITALELERLMNAAGPTGGNVVRLSNGEHPKNIVFIQCVGSRDVTCRGKSYCSKICCMYTAKPGDAAERSLSGCGCACILYRCAYLRARILMSFIAVRWKSTTWITSKVRWEKYPRRRTDVFSCRVSICSTTSD